MMKRSKRRKKGKFYNSKKEKFRIKKIKQMKANVMDLMRKMKSKGKLMRRYLILKLEFHKLLNNNFLLET